MNDVTSMIAKYLKDNKDRLAWFIFNIVRPLSYLRPPTYSYAFGYAMNIARAGYWSSKLGKTGKCVQIGSGVNIRGNTRNLEIGDYSHIDINVGLETHAPIKIGKYVHIAPNVYIQSGDDVIINDYAAVANGTKIYSASNTYTSPEGRENEILLSMSASAPQELQQVKYGKVIIEEYAFIGMNCVVLPGVRIGRGAIIGAEAVVVKDIPPYTIAVGIPAKPLNQRITPHPQINGDKKF